MAKSYESVVEAMDAWNDEEDLDKAEIAIDEFLDNTRNLIARTAASDYQRGEETFLIRIEDCYLSLAGLNELRKKYRDAGWKRVSVQNSAQANDRAGDLLVKLSGGNPPDLPDPQP